MPALDAITNPRLWKLVASEGPDTAGAAWLGLRSIATRPSFDLRCEVGRYIETEGRIRRRLQAPEQRRERSSHQPR